MASKIDTSEGSFMAELEGMESKRLEAATDYAGKLEDRYDIMFVRNINTPSPASTLLGLYACASSW